jgi:hypothetical protein
LKGFRSFPRDPTTIEGTLQHKFWSIPESVLTISSRSRWSSNSELSSKTPQDQHSRLRRKDLQCSLQTQRWFAQGSTPDGIQQYDQSLLETRCRVKQATNVYVALGLTLAFFQADWFTRHQNLCCDSLERGMWYHWVGR